MRDSLSFDYLRPRLHVSVLYNHQLSDSTPGEDKTLSWASMANDYLLNHQAAAFNSIQSWPWKFESIRRPLICLPLWSQTEHELYYLLYTGVQRRCSSSLYIELDEIHELLGSDSAFKLQYCMLECLCLAWFRKTSFTWTRVQNKHVSYSCSNCSPSVSYRERNYSVAVKLSSKKYNYGTE